MKNKECYLCRQKLGKSPGCSYDHTIDQENKVFERVRAASDCSCGAKKGSFHHQPCGSEKCPICGESLDSKKCQHWWEDFAQSGQKDKALEEYMYQISTHRFILFTLLTVGLYPFYWMYRVWKFLVKTNSLELNPLILTILWPIYIWLFASQIKKLAADYYQFGVSSVGVPLVAYFMYFSWLLGDKTFVYLLPFGFIAFLNLHTAVKNIYIQMFPEDFTSKKD